MNGIHAAWREVKPIVIALSSLSVLSWLFKQRWLSFLSTGLLAWVFYFFRDPERTPHASAEDTILAPADGRIMSIETVTEPLYFQGECQRVSIFLSLFDVHVQRMPYAGTVKKIHYQPGKFNPAFMQHADENEANFVAIETTHGPIGIKQMTGVLARRIICWVATDDVVERGQRFGLFKFGSRVDLFLPSQVQLFVETGQQLYGGKTVIGRWLSPDS